MRTALLVYGTRPEAIKLAPVVRALRESQHFRPIVAVTAQHRTMLDQVNALFGIEPEHDLDIITDRQTLGGITTRALTGLEPLLEQLAPDVLVVQGDTTTTFSGALAGFYAKVPVVHVEAGLRTGDRYSPYPEEINRRLTTQLAALHLAPTRTSRQHLLQESVDPASVVVTGNTVIDALIHVVDQARATPFITPELKGVEGEDRRILLVTAHRRESWGDGMRSVGRALGIIARTHPDVLVILPLHKNPVVREALLPSLEGLDNVVLTEPLDYREFAKLLDLAHVVLTDSGGVQEEAPSLGKPVLVMRETTERPEAVTAGTVRLVGTEERVLVDSVSELFQDSATYERMARAVNPYGDGKAAVRTVAAMRRMLGDDVLVDEFQGG